MIGLPTLTPLCGHIILNVVQSRLLGVITWMSKLEFSLRFLDPQKVPPFLLISGSILFMVNGIILGTPACQALSVIDDDWPISTLVA